MRTILPLFLLGCASAGPSTEVAVLDTRDMVDAVVAHGESAWPAENLVFDWIQTVWAYGVHRAYVATGDPVHQRYYADWMDDSLGDFEPTDFVSSDSMSPALMAATLSVEDPAADYGLITGAADDYLATAPRTQAGAIVHWGPDNPWGFPDDQVWVDSQFMFGLFLLRQFERTGERAYLDLFVDQYTLFSVLCRNQEDQLYHHAWDDASGENIPSDATYWARGNSWVLISAAEMLRLVGPDDPAWATVAPLFADHVAAVLPLQSPEDGLWRTVLNRPDDLANYTESSASALIGYALAVAIRADAPIDQVAAGQAIVAALAGLDARMSVDDDGVVHLEGTSVGTNPGTYEDYVNVATIDDLMLGYGAVLMFLAEADGLPVGGA